MDIRFLESFVAVAECGSIAEAARRLNLTSAALAQRLQSLEQSLGQPLVMRAGRTVRPTASGLAILPHARLLIEGARDLPAVAANNEPAGQLRLGATATSLTGLMPEIIDKMSHRFPRIEYFVQPGSSIELYHAVLAGKIDASIMGAPSFCAVITPGGYAYRREDGVLVVPITCLRP